MALHTLDKALEADTAAMATEALQEALGSTDVKVRRNAAKTVVNLMRGGENMQVLFSPMLLCVKTSDLELKKLVYLYLITYSRSEPEQAIMAVNTFIQDSQDGNPIIRALAVRNMCRIRIESVAEHLLRPLRVCLGDANAYVRKTAAYGVAKLYDVIPEQVEDAGLIQVLQELVSDENPLVIANAIAALVEVNRRRTTPLFDLASLQPGTLMATIEASTEWCQGLLLDAMKVGPGDEGVVGDRLKDLLKSSNPAVVVGAFRVAMMLEHRPIYADALRGLLTLVSSSDHHVQFVALRTIQALLARSPDALKGQCDVFFIKYSDPSYVNMEKLDILSQVTTAATVGTVLDEIQEYTQLVDVRLVRRSIRLLADMALKFEGAARRCVDILVLCLENKADYAAEEAVVVSALFLRRYPGVFDAVIGKIAASVGRLKSPESRGAAAWVLGEYCDIIEGSDVLLDGFIDTFRDEASLVQLQVLTSILKLYIRKPGDTLDLLQSVLTEATRDTVLPDVRSHAIFYWRLLSDDIKTCEAIVSKRLAVPKHAPLSVPRGNLAEAGRVAGVLRIGADDFAPVVKFLGPAAAPEPAMEALTPRGPPPSIDDLLSLEAAAPAARASPAAADALLDLLG